MAKWKEQFIRAGRAGLASGERRGPSRREAQLQAQVDELARVLGEAHVAQAIVSFAMLSVFFAWTMHFLLAGRLPASASRPPHRLVGHCDLAATRSPTALSASDR